MSAAAEHCEIHCYVRKTDLGRNQVDLQTSRQQSW